MSLVLSVQLRIGEAWSCTSAELHLRFSVGRPALNAHCSGVSFATPPALADRARADGDAADGAASA